MTETPQGRNRRVNRHSRSEEITPGTVSRPRQPRAPIGRSQELLERQEQLRQAQPVQPVRSQRVMHAYSDFDDVDFSAHAAKPVRKKKRRAGHTFLWLTVALICLLSTGVLLMFAAPQLWGITYGGMPNYAFVNGAIVGLDADARDSHEVYRQFMNNDRIFSGVYIDGVHVAEQK